MYGGFPVLITQVPSGPTVIRLNDLPTECLGTVPGAAERADIGARETWGRQESGQCERACSGCEARRVLHHPRPLNANATHFSPPCGNQRLTSDPGIGVRSTRSASCCLLSCSGGAETWHVSPAGEAALRPDSNTARAPMPRPSRSIQGFQRLSAGELLLTSELSFHKAPPLEDDGVIGSRCECREWAVRGLRKHDRRRLFSTSGRVGTTLPLPLLDAESRRPPPGFRAPRRARREACRSACAEQHNLCHEIAAAAAEAHVLQMLRCFSKARTISCR